MCAKRYIAPQRANYYRSSEDRMSDFQQLVARYESKHNKTITSILFSLLFSQ